MDALCAALGLREAQTREAPPAKILQALSATVKPWAGDGVRFLREPPSTAHSLARGFVRPGTKLKFLPRFYIDAANDRKIQTRLEHKQLA
jgi:hypothetical protein